MAWAGVERDVLNDRSLPRAIGLVCAVVQRDLDHRLPCALGLATQPAGDGCVIRIGRERCLVVAGRSSPKVPREVARHEGGELILGPALGEGVIDARHDLHRETFGGAERAPSVTEVKLHEIEPAVVLAQNE